ncbi:Uncharacterized protein DBV15_08077 [Temnothorax longispinosus]|uniref:Uncharacterized protein n=1 Tax=Temnothorax longispinosus TaxID=300112 RepID=A0A4S2JSL1_9HYME|nr:Uncharacterized protein DBV15_08077 [Temnothorax longispinosus]
MFRIADDFQLDKLAECSAEGSDAGEKLRKRSSRTAHTVHDRPEETLIVQDKANSKKEAGRQGKIEKHLYARTNVTHPLGCSET